MGYFKLRKGFSFIETVIALAVIAIIFIGVFGLQQVILQSTFNATNVGRRILLLKNVLYDPALVREKHDQELEKEKKIKNPETTITIERTKVTNKQLNDYALERVNVKADWQGLWPQDESLVALRFVVPKKEGKS
jgi:prepilin-type N-terminal cleavage/methylation domain-containing protein